MMYLPALLLLGCHSDGPAVTVVDEREAHRQWIGACQAETASYEACSAHCAQVADPMGRTDCYFQLAEAAPRWAEGDPRRAIALAYTLCAATPDFGAQCFRHSLHEIAITCSPRAIPWVDEPTWQAGERWAPWQSCVAKRVLDRQQASCFPARRPSYHNLWSADDAPLCGL
ncbi:MAG: hypothetical protein Q8P41_32140 [Pseudomonadota bacterium]|nr:hypothetical protein [Pseudomonadota bacterium]